ncbi:hypothetical protein, partial [Acinetobacter sp. TUM15064]|uniref:hypothetical protein n=1 Tax=Acinetobacter sp. TUM15064 TaxID=2609134 RepID=UPI001C079269
ICICRSFTRIVLLLVNFKPVWGDFCDLSQKIVSVSKNYWALRSFSLLIGRAEYVMHQIA